MEVTLNNFFIFNSTYGNNEGEEKNKILFYHPNTDHLDTQIKNVGLAEAIIQFTASFKPDGPIKSVHTLKRRQMYFQPEPNFWVVMTLNLPFIRKIKEGSEIIEYTEEDVQDNVYESVLKQAYHMYRLFSGTFVQAIEKTSLDILKTKLEQFFTSYFTTLKLHHCDIVNIFNGIQCLPLDKQTFLNVQCFINAMECNFPIIKHTAFLYNDHMIWSGIEPSNMQIVYQYLIKTLLPAHLGSELLCGSMPRNQPSPFAALHHGRFITGPENLKTSTSIGKIPRVHLYSDTDCTIYHLVVYRALSASVCLFIEEKEELDMKIFKELDDFIGPALTVIVSDIAEYCTKQVVTPSSQSETNPKFIYFNKMNLAYKSSVHLDNKQTGNIAVTKECLKLISDINANKDLLEYAGEVIVKTMNDYWVVGKMSNLREFYVALQQKNASLIEISDEVKKLCDTELKGIFFHSL